MTNEEARKILNSSLVWQKMVDEECEALEVAIKALELEPRYDCVSGQAIINAIANTCFWLSADNWNELMECINSLPPVTPQPKIGRWAILKDEYGDIVDAVCSCCDEHGNHKWTFCPHCGARMEVEDK